MLTVSDLRWMEEQRRRTALRRLMEADERALAGPGASRAERQQMPDLPAEPDVCDAVRGRPALARRLGCRG